MTRIHKSSISMRRWYLSSEWLYIISNLLNANRTDDVQEHSIEPSEDNPTDISSPQEHETGVALTNTTDLPIL